MIDLRSDTLTTPTPPMLEAMARARVGDDVYGEDPTITDFEHQLAELFGMEAGLLCVTGSLSNMLGVWLHTQPGTEVICDVRAHIVRAEMGGHALNHGVTTRTWTSSNGVTDADTVLDTIEGDAGPFLVRTSLVELENTHNFGGGTVWPMETIRAISEGARERGVAMHLDGARLWNAHIATGTPLAEYGACFDTISVCFSKGLGAPVGSMLLGSRTAMERARIQRKRLGAGWRQAGVLAAAAQYGVEHQLDRLAEDHAHARILAQAVAAKAPAAIDPEHVPTNIVVVNSGAQRAADVVAQAREQGVIVSAMGERVVRAVTYLGITSDECQAAGEVLGTILAQ